MNGPGEAQSETDDNKPPAATIESGRHALRTHFPQQHWLSTPLLIALPLELIEIMPKSGRNALNGQERAAEVALASIAESANAIGFYGDYSVRQPQLRRTPLQLVTQEQFDDLGWAKEGLTIAKVNRAMCQVAGATDETQDSLRAYVGFLLTSKAFALELSDLHRHRMQLLRSMGFRRRRVPLAFTQATSPFDAVLQAFLGRWMLSSLGHWRVPVAQGPVPPGFPTASAAGPFRSINVPVTINVPQRSKLEHLQDTRSAYLPEWVVSGDG